MSELPDDKKLQFVPQDQRSPLTPRLALRVAILGSFALAMFAIIFFRLWYLQVLSGEHYVKQALTNRVRDLDIPAPRGDIVDSSGNVLVDNTKSLQVQISPPDLPVPITPANLIRPAPRDVAVYGRMAKVLGMSMKRVNCPLTKAARGELAIDHVTVPRRLMVSPIACDVAQQYLILPYANVTVKKYVGPDVQYYIAERQDEFPGVEVQQVYLRHYPLGSLAAQLFGTIGPITAEEVKASKKRSSQYHGVSPNAILGQSGLELQYDRYLRGTNGAERVQVNANGEFEGNLSQVKPVAGHTLKLSLNVKLQKAGEQALGEAIQNNPPANAGAFVAMNPQNGEIYAMGSNPTFNPNVFTKPITQAKYNQLFGANSGFPQVNRATSSAYPTGSTFKGITATAGLMSGAWGVNQTYDDTGTYQDGPGLVRHNAGDAIYGTVNLIQAITVSSDDFFYNLGRLTNSAKPKGGALQQWARAYGIGRPTGVDTGGENGGILPSPAWRAGRDKLELECEHGTGEFKGHKPQANCGIADGRPWSVGDNENLAVGQGDLEATPLQLGVAYSAIENGGTIVRPHVGLEIDSGDGTELQKIDPAPARHLAIKSEYLDTIRQGLRDAASAPGGTSADVFQGFGEPVYGKTGTAERGSQAYQSWYVCYVPASATSKPILVVVTVEQGGFGAVAAAPAARQILSQWFYGKRGKFVVGSSKTL